MDIIIEDVGSISASVHHEERDISISKVVVVLIFLGRFIVAIRIVQFECVRGVGERLCRVIPETLEIIDNLHVH